MEEQIFFWVILFVGVLSLVVIFVGAWLYVPPTWMTPPPQNEDWICPYCKSKNDFEFENCGKCGAPESH